MLSPLPLSASSGGSGIAPAPDVGAEDVGMVGDPPHGRGTLKFSSEKGSFLWEKLFFWESALLTF